MKYFYRDPLEAAYMAKHYGMQFIDLENVFEHIGDFIHTIVEHDGPFLVHPDSLYLLDPVDGDTIYGPCGGEYFSVSDYSSFDADITAPLAKQSIAENGFQIVARWIDGHGRRAFFWPECEAA